MAGTRVSPFDREFWMSLSETQPSSRFKWYQTAIMALGALNYPEEIPNVYNLLLEKYILKESQFQETQKIREGLTKLCGIMGAAKTGTSLRQLAAATPSELVDPTYHREFDTREKALERGQRMLSMIYGKIPEYEGSGTLSAGPDYYHIARELLYGYIFSFDAILDIPETQQVIVSALLGIDCPEQARNHMLGFLMNGGHQEDLAFIRDIVSRIAERGGVHLRRVAKFETPKLNL